jgi:large repetitive protein
VPVRFDWGVVLPEQVIEGGSEELELELGEVQFAPGSAVLPPRYQPLVNAMATQVREHKGGEVVIQAEGDNDGLAFDRASAIKDALLAQLDGPAAKALTVSVRARPEAPASLVTGVRDDAALLGTVLFDTDKATIRSEFAPLLDTIAAALERQGGGNVVIVGHADRRGSHAYNSALGMQRAKAVFDALAGRLSASARATLRVEIENDPVAPNGARN